MITALSRLLRQVPGSVYAVLLLLVLFRFGSEQFLSVSNFVNILQQGSILSVVAIGSFLAILSHGIDLSLGAVVSFAGVVVALLLSQGYDVAVACLIALAASTLLCAVNGVLIAYTGIDPFIVTLGAMGTTEGLALILAKGATLPANHPAFKVLGGGNLLLVPLAALLALGCYALFGFLLKRTALGTHIYAIGGNEEAAVLAGIPVRRIKVLVYSLNGLLAGFAGLILAARLGAANPSQGIGIEFDGIAAAVVGGASLAGGRGNVWGAFMGAVIIAVLRNGLNMAGLPMALQMVIIGLIMVGVLTLDTLRRR
jgi:ribose/xylose/arabinose/galactoside ABC-type transport system permease subunit